MRISRETVPKQPRPNKMLRSTIDGCYRQALRFCTIEWSKLYWKLVQYSWECGDRMQRIGTKTAGNLSRKSVYYWPPCLLSVKTKQYKYLCYKLFKRTRIMYLYLYITFNNQYGVLFIVGITVGICMYVNYLFSLLITMYFDLISLLLSS